MMQASTHVFVILGWHSVLNVSSEPSSGSRLSCPRHGERHRLLVFSSSCVGNKDGKRVDNWGCEAFTAISMLLAASNALWGCAHVLCVLGLCLEPCYC